ncbi:MAG: TIGR04013 family B12-binding domain/radical SAM domain-containing protein [bacterium]|nr:TIGR04013 family B12-binding domain/radical SAM domain-containing protein [bacterium]
MKRCALVFFYTRDNRYSFNVLLGAIESSPIIENLEIFLLEDKTKLLDDLEEILKNYHKVILALSFLTPQIWDIYRVVKTIRDRFKDRILIIAGGAHSTGDSLGTLKMGFDIVIRGEGEETLVELLEKVIKNESYLNIKGISFLDKEGTFHSTGFREPIDLNRYIPFSLKFEKFNPIEISRGCPFGCSFCQTPRIFGTNPRHRSIEKILEYIKIMKERNLTDIRFIAPSIFSYGSQDGRTLNLDALNTLFKEIRKIIGSDGRIFIGTFPSEIRPEQVREETLELIVKYGNNRNITIGAQSGSDRVLELTHRGHTVSDIYRAVSIAKKAGFTVNVDFIFGLPVEKEEDIDSTVKVIEDLVDIGIKVHAHTFLPLPQTPLSRFKPNEMSSKYKKIINKLLPKGIVFGYWREQKVLADKIYRYLSTGNIEEVPVLNL